jgi:hypothetical protein
LFVTIANVGRDGLVLFKLRRSPPNLEGLLAPLVIVGRAVPVQLGIGLGMFDPKWNSKGGRSGGQTHYLTKECSARRSGRLSIARFSNWA